MQCGAEEEHFEINNIARGKSNAGMSVSISMLSRKFFCKQFRLIFGLSMDLIWDDHKHFIMPSSHDRHRHRLIITLCVFNSVHNTQLLFYYLLIMFANQFSYYVRLTSVSIERVASESSCVHL